MKTIELAEATSSLADYARDVGQGSLVVTRNGKPVAALVAVGDADLETVSLSTNPKFIAIIEDSRRRLREEGGISSDELRRRLGIKRKAKRSSTRRQT